MPLTYYNKDRYQYRKVPETVADWTLSIVPQNGIAGEGVKPPIVKTPKPWPAFRSPLPYERLMRRFSGVTTVAEIRESYSGQPFNRHRWIGPINHNSGENYPSLPVFPDNLRGRAVNEALNSLKGQKINLAVAFGERKETARFVGETLQDAVGLMRALRKKDLKGLYRKLKSRRKRQRYAKDALEKAIAAPSQLILKNSYALGPLMQDIYGGTEALVDADLAYPERYGVSVKKYVREKIMREVSFTHGVSNGYAPCIRQDSGMHGCMVRLDYYLENPLLRSLAQLGVTNPAELAWELIPFSFVFDWVLPIGSYLGALDATLGLTFRSGSRSELTRVYHKFIPNGKIYWTGSYANSQCIEYSVTGSGKQVFIKRSIYGSSPGPVFPSFKNPASLSHALNALSLVQQLLKSYK